jgi:hypothetical protein
METIHKREAWNKGKLVSERFVIGAKALAPR